MNITPLTGRMIVVCLLTAGTAACAANGPDMDAQTTSSYHEALATHEGSTDAIDSGVQAFSATFADLKISDFSERIEELYAETFYFNDTIHMFDRRRELVDYLERTAKGLNESRVEIHQILTDGPDVFVRWSMKFTTRVAGKNIVSDSIGMTHLRFDANGRIVLHQDFWDSGNALYAHLPVVGFFVRRARDSM